MSRTSHELAVLTQLEALQTNIDANNFATVPGFTETYYFDAEDVTGDFEVFIQGHPTLRGRILAVSHCDLTEATDGATTMIAGVNGADVNAYLETRLVPAEATNTNDTSDRDGCGNVHPNIHGTIGLAGVIPAAGLVAFLFTDVSTDTGIGDWYITIQWFE